MATVTYPIHYNVDYRTVNDKINKIMEDKGQMSEADLMKIIDPSSVRFVETDIGWVHPFTASVHKNEYRIDIDMYVITLSEPKRLTPVKKTKDAYDPVEHPYHYTKDVKYEPRKVIADWGLNFNLGNAVKYIARHDKKLDAIQDLRKAIQYIEFEIEELSKEDQNE